MKEWDIQRVKAVLLYILNYMPEQTRDVYHVVKAAYYAQQYHFVRYATRLYVDNVVALPFGPVPSLIYNVLKAVRGEVTPYRFCNDKILARLIAPIEYKNEWLFYATEEPDMDCLSESNIECLNDAITFVAKMGFNELMNETHGAAWNRAYYAEDHKMDDIAIAKEGGANESTLYYLAETLENEKLFN